MRESLNELEKVNSQVVGKDEVCQVKWYDLVKRNEETLQELKQIMPLTKSDKRNVEHQGQE